MAASVTKRTTACPWFVNEHAVRAFVIMPLVAAFGAVVLVFASQRVVVHLPIDLSSGRL
jgi:hypothetical protein